MSRYTRSRRSRAGAPAFSIPALLLIALLTDPARVEAFSDVESFEEAAATGGAGGRRFTGSPSDPYTCKVCHEHGEAPAVRVLGLPIGGYEPSVAYEITVDWSDRLDKVAATVELTDEKGRRAGSLRLAGEAEQQPAELCAGNTQLAATVATVAPFEMSSSACPEESPQSSACRQVVYSDDCGAQRLRVLWTAPKSDIGRIWFAGVVVSTDGDSTSQGDGTTELGRFLQSRDAEVSAAGCSLLPRGAADSPGASLCFGLALCAWGLRRCARRR